MSLLDKTVLAIEPASKVWREKATKHIEGLLMPHWAMGRALDIAVDIAGITRTITPEIGKRSCLVFGADHGIAEEGVSPCPQNITPFMMSVFTQGGAAINVLARHIGASIVVVDTGVKGDLSELKASGKIIDKHIAEGTKNFLHEKAMTPAEAIRSIEAGIETVLDIADSNDVFIIGEMGIGNTTPSSTIVASVCKIAPEIVTGCGAGLDEKGRVAKAEVISKALSLHNPDANNAIDILSKVGGFEIGAMAGAMLAAASLKKPVIVDGFICTAAALIAQLICPTVTDSLILGHASVERGHVAAAEKLGLQPILNLDLRLGEGSGAAMAFPIVEAGVKLMKEMFTFEQMGISLS